MKQPTEHRNNTSSVTRYGVLVVVLVAFGLPLLISLAQTEVGFSIFLALFITAIAVVLMAMLVFYGVKLWTHFTDKDTHRKAKHDEILTAPAEPLESEPAYTLSSDGEVLEVIDDAPPTLSFKLNDQGDESI